MRRRVALLVVEIIGLVFTLPLAVIATMYATGNVLSAFLAPIIIYSGLMYLIVRPIPRLIAELTADQPTGSHWDD
jgi:hypothetical protein